MNPYIKSATCILLSLFMMMTYSCGRNAGVNENLDRAEQLMEEKPDSSLAIINGIDSSSIKGDEEAARYALLKSMALDKNYIDTTTFDIINPAVEYYTKHGTPDEKFKTYYYCGRIYRNQGDDYSAMKQYMKADDLKSEISDSLMLARNLVAMGTLYFKQYKIDKFIETNLQAAKLYGNAGKRKFEIWSYTNALDGYVIKDDRSSADSILSICLPLVHDYPEGEHFLFSSVLSYTIEFGTSEEISSALNEYKDMELDQNDVLNIAYGYSKVGDSEKAIDIISNLKIEGSILDSLKGGSII